MLLQFLEEWGDSKVPFYAVLISLFLNIILDLLLVIVFNLGTDGALLVF